MQTLEKQPNLSFFETSNKVLNDLMPVMTPLAVIIGLLLGDYVSWMKPAVNWLFGIMTFFGAMKISVKEVGDTLKKPTFLLAFALGSYIFMPLVAYAISHIFFNGNKEIISGYILLRATPTAVVSTVWTTIYCGNMAASISVLILDSFLSPVLTPFILKLYTGESIAIDSVGMMQSLLFMVLIPSFLGLVANHFFSHQIKRLWAPVTNPIAKLLIDIVIIINTSQQASSIIENASWQYLLIAFGNILMATIGFSLGFLFSRLLKLDREKTISVTFSTSMRNTSAALVLAISFLPSAASLPCIFGIIFQQCMAAIMSKLYFDHLMPEKTAQ
jgi:bile acid:Na+ symporter, BASS family